MGTVVVVVACNVGHIEYIVRVDRYLVYNKKVELFY